MSIVNIMMTSICLLDVIDPERTAGTKADVMARVVTRDVPSERGRVLTTYNISEMRDAHIREPGWRCRVFNQNDIAEISK
jgi:peroxiredoxin